MGTSGAHETLRDSERAGLGDHLRRKGCGALLEKEPLSTGRRKGAIGKGSIKSEFEKRLA